ncbi:MAG: hypothetical protein RIR18_1071 [Pseudomonadota bacterium]
MGGLGTDTINLSSQTDDVTRVVFSTVNDGAAAGARTGYDTVNGFTSGKDKIVFTGNLNTLLDRNGDSAAAVVSRSANAINVATDEVCLVTSTTLTKAGLTSLNFSAVITAIGALKSSYAGASLLVALVTNDQNTGLYVVTDTNGDGTVANDEIRLLGIVDHTLAVEDFVFG